MTENEYLYGFCDICHKKIMKSELLLTAISSGEGADMCSKCFEEFVKKVIEGCPPSCKDTFMKLDPDAYEKAMKLLGVLGVPEEQWITYDISNPEKTFWNGITCLVNKKAYLKFIKGNKGNVY